MDRWRAAGLVPAAKKDSEAIQGLHYARATRAAGIPPPDKFRANYGNGGPGRCHVG